MRPGCGSRAMTGGRSSYGPGGYYKSPLEPILPVSMELRNEHRKLSLAMVVVSGAGARAQIASVGNGGPGPVKAEHLTAELTTLSPQIAVGGTVQAGLVLLLFGLPSESGKSDFCGAPSVASAGAAPRRSIAPGAACDSIRSNFGFADGDACAIYNTDRSRLGPLGITTRPESVTKNRCRSRSRSYPISSPSGT